MIPITPTQGFDLTDKASDLVMARPDLRPSKGHQGGPTVQAATGDRHRLEEAARAFESFFIASLVKEMRKSIPKNDLFGEGSGQELYQSLFDDALGQALVEHGGLGLTQQIMQQNFKKGMVGDKELGKFSR